MTDDDIFAIAVESARSVSYWRQRAAEAARREQAGPPRGPYDLTRRQCLARVRYGQARIVDLAIAAESICRRERHAANPI